MKQFYTLLIIATVGLTCNAQIIDIPDANFKNALVNTNCVDTDGVNYGDSDADTNNDGEISVSEAEAVVEGLYISSNSISSLDGIEFFTNLTELWCGNNSLTNINNNISSLSNLRVLYCNDNQLTNLEISNIPNLELLCCYNNQMESLNVNSSGDLTLICRDNQLTTINTDNLPNLRSLSCRNNLITSLNFENNPLLVNLSCNDNLIGALDLTNQTQLESVNCQNNQITELTFGTIPGNVGLGTVFTLNCSNNLLSELDLSSVYMTQHGINVSNNQLTTLILKNGVPNIYDYPELFGQVVLTNNPDLGFICVDPFEQSYIEGSASSIPDCVVNSYCNYFPGGEYFLLEGNIQLDLNNNGCDDSDDVISNLNIAVSSGSVDGNFVSNSSGDYFIPVQDGNHTITPIFENPEYYSISPSSFSIEFPEDGNSNMQDFCVSPNGIYNDLEITIIPIDDARPGFDAYYKLIYKNKGTTALSGSVDLTFQDDLMDLVSTNPNEDSQSGNTLTWNFADLNPFENREILFTMNINSPMDTPPVNDGDLLVFEATVSSSETDETPVDNTFTLNQTVVNSFDPNDKTCLEGETISPEQLGEYLHYRIRFENTGTANAVNIVVKDNIDRNTLDLSTLVVVDASHEVFIRSRDFFSDYYVEFIFENINLPFDDANNDGYVVFKIKTLDTLALDDLIENEAEIYFDFNFPIITNVAETTVATLSTEDVEIADNGIVLFPNPTLNTLFVKSEHAIEAISIYDISGRLIQELSGTGPENTIEIHTNDLASGTYFLNIKTNDNSTVKSFIKA